MAFPVLFEVSRVLSKPIFEPGIVIAIVARVSLPPSPVVIRLQGGFTGRFSTDLLALADFRVRDKLGLAVGTLFHPGPPLKKRIYTNQTNQKTKMNEDKLKGKNHRIFFLSQ
jgi:hypothetical protein